METFLKRNDRVTVTDGPWTGFDADVEAADVESGLAVVLVYIGFSLKRIEIPLSHLKRQEPSDK